MSDSEQVTPEQVIAAARKRQTGTFDIHIEIVSRFGWPTEYRLDVLSFDACYRRYCADSLAALLHMIEHE